MSQNQSTRRATASSVCVNIGLLLVMAATAMPLLGLGVSRASLGPAFGWVYGAGALLSLIGRLMAPSIPGASLRLSRLRRMETWTAVIFCVGAVFIFVTRSNDWIAFTMAGAILTVYAAIMIARTVKAEKAEKNEKKR